MADSFIRECWSLQGVAFGVVALRFYSKAKTRGWRKLQLDDALMGLAVLIYCAETVAAYILVARFQGYANNGNITDEYRLDLYNHRDGNAEYRMRVDGSKTHVAGLLLYTTLMWTLKACWVVYYSRLTEGVHNKRRTIQIAYVVTITTYISCLLVAFLKCIPFQHQWQIYPDPGNNCMPGISSLQTIYVMVMNTLTDFYLMAIPLPIIWGANLRWRKKIALLVMFSGGLLEMTFGILRCVSISTLGNSDPAQSGFWSVRESFVSCVLTNMPMIYPLIKNLVDGSFLRSRSGNFMTGSNPNGSHGPGSASRYRLESRPGRKNMGKTASLTNVGWGSDENIVDKTDAIKGSTRSSGEDSEIYGLRKGPTPGKVEISSPKTDVARRLSIPGQGIIVTQEYQVSNGTSSAGNGVAYAV